MQNYKSKFKKKKHLPLSTQRDNCVTEEKNMRPQRKKINKNSVLSVVKKIWGWERWALCAFYSFCFLIFNILYTKKVSNFKWITFYRKQ